MPVRLIALALALLAASPACAAPTPTRTPLGLWWTQDRRGVIEIYPCGADLCGRIVGEDQTHDRHGNRPVDTNGTPDCGLTILRNAHATDTNEWRGIITNPEDGSNWNCELWIGDDGNLRLRGYVLIPLFGETQIWPRFDSHVGPDCAIR